MHNNKKIYTRRTGLWIITALVTLIVAFIIYFLLIAVDHPPAITDRSVLEIKREKIGENTYAFGNNWLRKSESGLWEMYIEGDPFERGVAFGALTQELLYYQETAFVEQIRELVPSDSYLKILKYFLAWFNRNLDKSITQEYKEEIYGTSLFASREYDFIGSGYQRQLNYHAAHDIGHALQGLNMVGCTSFACWDAKTSDSCLIIGRNFDFYSGDKFAENKIVCFVNPSTGYKFMMVTWADMSGVVSGMNEQGLTITLNAAKSNVPFQAATPVSILAREILQYASNIEEAYDISRKRKMFVSESLLIGSKKDGKAAIIEKSPEKTGLFQAKQDQIVCSNHFQSETFASDEINLENIRESDSKYRFDRMEELISENNPVNIETAASILRNQKGLKNVDLGMGNQLAINQLIAHHSVIFKPDSLFAWVSSPPFQLGKFVTYDFKHVFNSNASDSVYKNEIYTSKLTIPADTFFYSDEYNAFKNYLSMTRSLKNFGQDKETLPGSFEKEYIKTNPQYYLTYINLGDYFYEIENYKTALNYYKTGLTKEIPGTSKKNELEKQMKKIAKKLN